ncbi:MAG TPA: hypothetical protein VK841_04270, partial [Polyangiaceae bacterium]|nr:hypothetical protein [Polyangiaceae bacterium]
SGAGDTRARFAGRRRRCYRSSAVHVQRRRNRASRKGLRPLAGAVARLFVAAALVLASLHAGAHYFYCEAIGLSATDPCAQASHEGPGCPLEASRVEPIDCCQRITNPALPDGARAEPPTVPPAPLVSLLPAIPNATSVLRRDPNASLRFSERWRGPPRWGDDRRTQLMVFLT